MEKAVVTLSDYRGMGESFHPTIDVQEAREVISDNLSKGKISEELFTDGMEACDIIEKGKKGTVGEIRDWSGKKYQKTATGWVPVKGIMVSSEEVAEKPKRQSSFEMSE